jgi:hypothetical protein
MGFIPVIILHHKIHDRNVMDFLFLKDRDVTSKEMGQISGSWL